MHLQDHIEDYSKELRGNWKTKQDFSWYRKKELPDLENWAVVYTHNRDSNLRSQSNAAAIAKALEEFEGSGDLNAESHDHWGCGWISGYSIRVYSLEWNGTGEPQYTETFKRYCELLLSLGNEPVLDEADYSERTKEATLDVIEKEAWGYAIDSLPEDWVQQVFDWLNENYPDELESRDDRGGYPSDESLKQALAFFGWLEDCE